MSNALLIVTEKKRVCASLKIRKRGMSGKQNPTPLCQAAAPIQYLFPNVSEIARKADVERLIIARRKIFGDNAIRLLLALCDGNDENLADLADRAGVDNGNAHRVLSEFKNMGLVTRRQEGKHVYYKLDGSPDRVYTLFNQLLSLGLV